MASSIISRGTWKSAHDARPVTLAALQTWLARLAASATNLAGGLDPGTGTARDKEAEWWADALARQCRSALDELTFLAPWLVLPAGPRRLAGLLPAARIPTLRELSRLAADLLPAIEQRRDAADVTAVERQWLQELERLVTEGSTRASQRIAALEGLAADLGEIWRAWNTTSCTTRPATCSPSGTTSASGGAIRLLRSAGVGGAVVQLRRHRAGQAAAGKLVRPRPPAHYRRRGRDAPVVERLDVRIPDAAAGDAHLREHAARPHLSARRSSGRSTMGVSAACRGASRNRGYNTIDAALNYQYRAFGVPGLGFKRGLAEDLVIAPYATALALMVAPEEACANLQRLAARAGRTHTAFTRPIDYTPSRLPRGQSQRSCGRSWRITRA